MGFVGDLFNAETRRRKRVASLSKKLQQKYGQSDDRMAAAAELRKIGGEDAFRGLLKRFSVTCDNKLHDQDEKREISDILVDLGPQVLPQIREFLVRETEVTWAVRTLKSLEPRDEWVTTVLGVLGDKTSEDTDPEKICQLLTVLHEESDSRVGPAIARCLTDLDDTVRFAAVEALATLEDAEAAREPLLAALARPEEDSNRVIHRIIEVFRDRGWEVKGYRRAVEERLPEGFYLDRSGHIKQLAAGATEAPEL